MVVFATAAIYMQNATTFALHVTDLGYSTRVYGFLLAMNGVLVVLFELPIKLMDAAPAPDAHDRARRRARGPGVRGAGVHQGGPRAAADGGHLDGGEETTIEAPATSAFVADLSARPLTPEAAIRERWA